jgi:hypothetical protein
MPTRLRLVEDDIDRLEVSLTHAVEVWAAALEDAVRRFGDEVDKLRSVLVGLLVSIIAGVLVGLAITITQIAVS